MFSLLFFTPVLTLRGGVLWGKALSCSPTTMCGRRTLALTCSGSSPSGSGSGVSAARCRMRRHICGDSLGRSRSSLRLGCARCSRTLCPALELCLLPVGTGHFTVFVLAQLLRPVLLASLSLRSARSVAGASALWSPNVATSTRCARPHSRVVASSDG